MAAEGSIDDAQYTRNKVISALPPDSRQRLLSVAQTVQFNSGEMVHWAVEPIEYVLFPLDGVVSIVSALREGTISEVGTIGREGMVGVAVVLGLDSTSLGAMSQVPGASLRVPAAAIRHELARSDEARAVFNRYLHALFMHLHTHEQFMGGRWKSDVVCRPCFQRLLPFVFGSQVAQHDERLHAEVEQLVG